MQLVVVAVGVRMPGWVDAAFDDYAQRMPPDLRIVLREIRPEARTSGKPVESLMRSEAERIHEAFPKRGTRIALDERGEAWSSTDLAGRLERWRADGDDVAFAIGGPDGLDPSIKDQAHARMALSKMTLPHGLVRVLLAEQLYRAWSITQNHPYHRA
jgi:23S rRNA (pseudouridine1915-N3)-methyltransferase